MATQQTSLQKRPLTLLDVVAQAVGFMGPVASAVFLIPLIAGASASGQGAGVATPLSLALATVGVLAIAWIISRFAQRIHGAGGIYDYVTASLGTAAGFIAGWVYYLGAIALACGSTLLLGGFLSDFLSSTWNVQIPYLLVSLFADVIIFAVLYFGIQVSTRAQFLLVSFSFVTFGAFSLYVVVKVGFTSRIADVVSPSHAPNQWLGVFYGIVYALLLFVGFESAANLAEETPNPRKVIPKALLGSVLVVGVYYVVCAYAAVAGKGFDGAALASDPVPLVTLSGAGHFGSAPLADVMQIMVALDLLALAIGASVAASRGIFALARDRHLPAVFTTVHRRYGVPLVASAFVVACIAAAAVITRLGHGVFSLATPTPNVQLPEYIPMFGWLAGIGAFCIALIYAAICVGAFVFQGRNRGTMACGLVGIAAVALGVFGAVYQVPYPGSVIPWVTVGWAVIGVLVVALNNKAHPRTTSTETTSTL